MPRNAWQDAVVGYAGPALGSVGALTVAAGASATDSQLLYALADFGYMVSASREATAQRELCRLTAQLSLSCRLARRRSISLTSYRSGPWTEAE